ncbi:MAG: hypothetical protein AAF546_11115 [Verrucomicrobiota bacterium]
METIISVSGSISSIIGLIFVWKSKSSNGSIRALLALIALLSIGTSYLLIENKEYASEEYRQHREMFTQGLKKSGFERDALQLYESLPTTARNFDSGTNEGIIYSTLALLERGQEVYPVLYAEFRTNVLDEIKKAKEKRGSSEYDDILKDGATASIRIVRSLSWPSE